MRTDAANVKQLACLNMLWHSRGMEKPKTNSKEDRLAQALRANLRRRKTPNAGEGETKKDPPQGRA